MLLREIDDFKLLWSCSIEMLWVLAFPEIEILRSLEDQAFGFGWGRTVPMAMDMVFREADSRNRRAAGGGLICFALLWIGV